jgi:acyl carrier protein
MSTSIADIEQKVIEIISSFKKVEPSTFTRDSVLNEDMDIQSLDLVDILMDLEDAYGIELIDDQLLSRAGDDPVTVAIVADFIAQKVNNK